MFVINTCNTCLIQITYTHRFFSCFPVNLKSLSFIFPSVRLPLNILSLLLIVIPHVFPAKVFQCEVDNARPAPRWYGRRAQLQPLLFEVNPCEHTCTHTHKNNSHHLKQRHVFIFRNDKSFNSKIIFMWTKMVMVLSPIVKVQKKDSLGFWRRRWWMNREWGWQWKMRGQPLFCFWHILIMSSVKWRMERGVWMKTFSHVRGSEVRPHSATDAVTVSMELEACYSSALMSGVWRRDLLVQL